MALEHRLAEQAAALAELSAAGLPSLGDSSLHEAVVLLGEVRRLVDALGIGVSAEVARRWDATALAARWGARSAADAVSAEGGIDPAEARAWGVVGDAIRIGTALTGEPVAPRRPELATAVASASLPAAALARIATTLDEVDRRAPGRGDALAPILLAEAGRLTPRELGRVCRFAIERADPDGVELREEELRARSGIEVAQLPDGMLRWVVTMDPESAGFLQAAIDARTAPRRRPRFGDGTDPIPNGEPALDEEAVRGAGPDRRTSGRTLARRRLDALVGIARASLRADDGELAGADVTMLVTVSLDALRAGLGAARIDGVDAPISARTARRLAADARLVPVVLGGESEPLDLGRSSRLFSRAQRRALSIRDGGCVWPGCTAPPSWCEVAHVEPWARGGPTDLRNAMLMCPFHHRRFDLDGWSLEHRDRERWLVPPPWVDARRRPRRVGRRERMAA